MTKTTPLSRPAASAIAAFLVLSTPSAFAQEVPAAQPAPPTVMVPPVAPTAAPSASAPAPAPVLRVPLDIAPEPAAPEPAAAAAAPRAETKAAPRAPARTAARAAPAERATSAATLPAAAAALPRDAAIPELTEPAIAPVAPVVDPVPAAAPAEHVANGSAVPWEVAGGAAALLLIGGAGLVFARRRRTLRDADAWEFGETAENSEWVPAAPTAARTADPLANPEPIPAPRAAEEPVRRTTPAFAAAPSGSMGRHEAMALVGPTADNPFATLAKRLKRARFLDRKEQLAYDAALAGEQPANRQPVSAWEIAQRPAPVPAEQLVRRPEPVTRGLSHSFRRPGFARD
ncbi:hypothetical protein EAO27_04055 [Sphingopyxis sp. YF1]|uniref:hypothetical protein n=1 Tax=Sphingopyxis sp. YF1 TaxID=2482763 RepID=UPI001F6024BC|nr:hypothetical protein [Sphingopyxis sp. YF1]UNU41975.1 hypothetical protein EAO27_04055 [Sphingopyxis sp. YF1]